MKSRRFRFFGSSLVASLALCLAANARAENCRVVDPELLGEYHGGCADGLADGYGVAVGISRYEGSFVAGKKHGQGVKVWPNGDRFAGGFKDDKRDGNGLYRWGTGSKWSGDFYLGNYFNDNRHGWGAYEWANGDRFEGEWKEDLRYGYSAMEIQRQRTKAAWAAYLSGGSSPVCAEIPQGLASRVSVSGTAEGLAEERLNLRILHVDATALTVTAGIPAVGESVSLAYSEAYPCTLEQ